MRRPLCRPAASQHWSDYPIGVIASWRGEGAPMPGFSLSLWGDVPSGSGLSSSAAVEVSTALAVTSLSGRPIRGLHWRACASARRTCSWAPAAASWTSSSPPTAQRIMPCCWIAAISVSSWRRSRRRYALVIANTMVKHSVSGGEYTSRRAEVEEAATVIAPSPARGSFSARRHDARIWQNMGRR